MSGEKIDGTLAVVHLERVENQAVDNATRLEDTQSLGKLSVVPIVLSRIVIAGIGMTLNTLTKKSMSCCSTKVLMIWTSLLRSVTLTLRVAIVECGLGV